MNTYWVYENIRKQISFYNELDILLLLSSATLWKKHHPTYTNILYVDKLTQELIYNLNAQSIWEEIKVLPENKFVDKGVFWASSKLEVLRYITGPSIIMDHDFLVYTPLDAHFNDNVVIAVEEDGTRYYPSAYDPYMKAVSKLLTRPKSQAINCCFLYFPNSTFANYYAEKSLELMQQFTKLKVPNSKYLIVSEQLLLKHLLDSHNIRYDSLMKARWDCRNRKYVEHPVGIYDLDESFTKFRHYWMDKVNIKESKNGFNFTDEISILKNILAKKEINYSALDDIKS